MDSFLTAFWLWLLSKIFDILTLVLIGVGIYKFKNKIKTTIKSIVEEAIKETIENCGQNHKSFK